MARTQQNEAGASAGSIANLASELPTGWNRATLEAVLASMKDACFMFDGGGRLIYANDAAIAFHRLTSRAGSPQTLAESAAVLEVSKLSGEPVKVEDWALARALRGEAVMGEECRLSLRGTGESWIGSYNCTPIRDAAGKVLGALVIARDITEEKGMLERLKESENRYRSLVETTSDWVWEIDAEGRYRYASPKVTELLGYLPEEVMGRSPFELMAPAEAERVLAICSDLMKRHKPIRGVENVNLHKNGHEVILETNATPIFGSDGTFEGYRGMDRDITIRKRALEALEHSRDLMRYVLEHMHSAVAIHDRELRYLYVSQQYLDDYGIRGRKLSANIITRYFRTFPRSSAMRIKGYLRGRC